ncbi:MAG TPA: hypothetical protein VJA94_16190 [Candidatus Angelobacter sp.]
MSLIFIMLSVFLGASAGDTLSTAYVQKFVAKAQAAKASGLIMVGTIEDLGEVPGACEDLAFQFVTFRVERVLWGTWHNSTIRVGYGNCSFRPLPDPPFKKGAKVIVFVRYTDVTFIDGGYAGDVHSAQSLGIFPPLEDNVKTVEHYVRTMPKR